MMGRLCKETLLGVVVSQSRLYFCHVLLSSMIYQASWCCSGFLSYDPKCGAGLEYSGDICKNTTATTGKPPGCSPLKAAIVWTLDTLRGTYSGIKFSPLSSKMCQDIVGKVNCVCKDIYQQTCLVTRDFTLTWLQLKKRRV